MTESLNLAIYINSPDRSTKSTRSHFNVLSVLVSAKFQVLFHSPPGVLFTFPSRYFSTIGHQVVFRLGGWSPLLPTGFLVSRRTPDTRLGPDTFAYGSFTLCGWPSHTIRLASFPISQVQNPKKPLSFGLASSAFARHYLRNLC